MPVNFLETLLWSISNSGAVVLVMASTDLSPVGSLTP
jgi:hypothetical protein